MNLFDVATTQKRPPKIKLHPLLPTLATRGVITSHLVWIPRDVCRGVLENEVLASHPPRRQETSSLVLLGYLLSFQESSPPYHHPPWNKALIRPKLRDKWWWIGGRHPFRPTFWGNLSSSRMVSVSQQVKMAILRENPDKSCQLLVGYM